MEIMNWQEITMFRSTFSTTTASAGNHNGERNILEDQRIIQSVASKIVPENGTESF